MTTAAASAQGLFMTLELSKRNWKLAFSNGLKVRQINVPAGDFTGLAEQITRAKAKLNLPADAPVRAVYEAGRDGFWIHRRLVELRIENLVVDAASIEVDRRARRAKTDRLDAGRLVRMLMRYHGGEHTLWRVVRVPTVEQEDARRLHRELERLKKERTAHRARVSSLQTLHRVPGRLTQRWLKQPVAQWPGLKLPAALLAELERERQRLVLVDAQIAALAKQQVEWLAAPQTATQQQAAKLTRRRGVVGARVWVAGVDESPAGGGMGRVDGDAVRQRGQSARPGHQQGRQQTGALGDGATGMGVVAILARERVDAMVLGAVWARQRAATVGGDRGVGAQTVGGVVAVSNAGSSAGRRGAEAGVSR